MHHAHIDKFAYQDSPIHALDSRVKFIVTLIFTVLVVSLPRTSVAILFCFAVGPFAILVLGKIPLRFVAKHIIMVSPFIALLALTCPWYDRAVVDVAFGPFSWRISAGWLRCAAIGGKFVVSMMALIAMVSTTRFGQLLAGLERLAVPQVLILQLGFIYRYIFVLIDTAQHLLRARTGRKLRHLGLKKELNVAASMVGSLFTRSLNTAEKINTAMQARGFDGNWRTVSKLKIRRGDVVFALAAAVFMFGLYLGIVPLLK